MSMPAKLRLRFELYGKLRIHQYRVQQARARVSEWLKLVKNPYIAFSTGKDSSCVLHLVREQAPDISAVCIGLDDLPPESTDIIALTDNVIIFPPDEPYTEVLKREGLLDVSWRKLDNATMQASVWGPIKRLIKQFNFDGVAYGLRAEEAEHRRMHLQTRGAIFQYKRDGLWACAPLADWKYDDVWAYIVSNNLPYCGMYDLKWDMPEEDQRLSFWMGETKRHWGRYAWLKRNYPELFNRLAAEFPEVRGFV